MTTLAQCRQTQTKTQTVVFQLVIVLILDILAYKSQTSHSVVIVDTNEDNSGPHGSEFRPARFLHNTHRVNPDYDSNNNNNYIIFRRVGDTPDRDGHGVLDRYK